MIAPANDITPLSGLDQLDARQSPARVILAPSARLRTKAWRFAARARYRGNRIASLEYERAILVTALEDTLIAATNAMEMFQAAQIAKRAFRAKVKQYDQSPIGLTVLKLNRRIETLEREKTTLQASIEKLRADLSAAKG